MVRPCVTRVECADRHQRNTSICCEALAQRDIILARPQQWRNIRDQKVCALCWEYTQAKLRYPWGKQRTLACECWAKAPARGGVVAAEHQWDIV